jgi:DNA-binding NarL/FixJ family response regulator
MKQTILVVDDEDDICTSLQERLTMEGYKVLTASDGRKGLRVYHDHLVDLVITDVLMPELDVQLGQFPNLFVLRSWLSWFMICSIPFLIMRCEFTLVDRASFCLVFPYRLKIFSI